MRPCRALPCCALRCRACGVFEVATAVLAALQFTKTLHLQSGVSWGQ